MVDVREIRLYAYLIWTRVIHWHARGYFRAREDGIYCTKCERRFRT